MSDKEKQHIVAEVNILRDLKHPNIVRYYDRIVDKKNTKIYIIMEYCEGGDIGSLIKKCKKNKVYYNKYYLCFTYNIKLLGIYSRRRHMEDSYSDCTCSS